MILLDTHIWLRWLAPGDAPLSPAMVQQLDAADDVADSAVSFWEVAYLFKRGRLMTLDHTIPNYPELTGLLG